MLRALLLSLCLCLTSCHINTPTSGQKIGRIVKLANEGMLCKTCEGELIRGGLVDGSGSMGTSFKFTIEDVELKRVARKALLDQSEVILYYRTELVTSITRSECSQPHFVTNIEIVR